MSHCKAIFFGKTLNSDYTCGNQTIRTFANLSPTFILPTSRVIVCIVFIYGIMTQWESYYNRKVDI